ncbi:MAG: hypothetical protein KatS3mg061_1481 [Dehalococcoidia bacterium]|nr:MAG: hypothetical protein KatS3mg061_1481 [Dehalococcoidia bacterium]
MQPAPPAAPPAAPAPAEVPQFGGANTLAWPPVFSGEIQATVGNATVIVGLVGNRTLREHAFVDVRWWLPTAVRVLDSYAGNNPGVNRGKLEGLSAAAQQLGWVNHFVRQGQVQGPFFILLDNSGRSFRVWSWLWFSTASDERAAGAPPGAPVLRRNGNYTSRGVEAGASPLAWSAEFNTAAASAGVAALAPAPAPAR